MNHWKLPAAILSLAIVTGLGLQLWYWPLLPDPMATRFNEQGQPTGWMAKLPATLISAALLTILPLFLIGSSLVIRWLPISMINLPNREYWLAEERREETIQWITTWMLWLTVSVTLLMVAINHLTFIANRDNTPISLFLMWGMLGLFVFSILVFLLFVFRRFRRNEK